MFSMAVDASTQNSKFRTQNFKDRLEEFNWGVTGFDKIKTNSCSHQCLGVNP